MRTQDDIKSISIVTAPQGIDGWYVELCYKDGWHAGFSVDRGNSKDMLGLTTNAIKKQLESSVASSADDLSKKLTDTLVGVFNAGFKSGAGQLPEDVGPEIGRVTAIAQIEQAFIDAGWSPIERLRYNPNADNYSERFPRLMTGQEWYDQFMRHLDLNNNKAAVAMPRDQWAYVLDAAKKASGIK